MRVISLSIILPVLLLHTTNSEADANDGDLFGYTLGSRYLEQESEPAADGQLVLIAAQNPVKPAAIENVYVLVTPVSHTIGKIAGETWFESGEEALVAYERFRGILRDKYGDWETQERTDQQFHASRFWMGDNELNVQVSGPHQGDLGMSSERVFRFTIALSFQPSSDAAVRFETLANEEIAKSTASRFTEEETQGL
jgi:hypothetical protein